MTHVELENQKAGWTKNIVCDEVSFSGGKNLGTEPNQNGDVKDVIENTYENVTYRLSQVFITGNAGDITYQDIVDIYTATDNELFLTIPTGSDGSVLTSLQGANAIPVTLADFDGSINMSDADFRGRADQPFTLSLSFVETQ
jgi:hypothetical protein